MNLYLSTLNSLCLPSVKGDEMTAVSFFSGGGGLDLGLSLAGFNFKYANDEVSSYCDTISHNFPDCIAETKNITYIKGEDIKNKLNFKAITLIAGGPPCQSFSILGRRGSFSDLRGQLVFEFARLIKELKPDAFIFENVPGILTLNQGKDWKELFYYFEVETGYELYSEILNSADYGVPQIRKRIFLVGFRQPTKFEFPVPTHRAPSNVNLFNQFLPEWLPAKLAL